MGPVRPCINKALRDCSVLPCSKYDFEKLYA